MLKQISMRIPKEFYDTLEELSKIEKQEKSYIVREALKKGLEDLRKELAIKLYKDKKATLSEAAKLADVGAGEMMDFLIKEGVKSDISIEDFEDLEKSL